MKLQTYLILANVIAATQSIVKIVDQPSNATQLAASSNASTTTPQSSNSLASLSGGDPYDADK